MNEFKKKHYGLTGNKNYTTSFISLEFERRVLRELNFAVLKTDKQKNYFFHFVKSTVLFQGPHRGHGTGKSYIGLYLRVAI